MRTHMTCFVFAVMVLLCSVSSTEGQLRGTGHAWANDAAAANYVPDTLYSYNSSGGSIQASRSAPGNYSILFEGLGGNGRNGGNVQVTAYGDGRDRCSVVGWNSLGADFIANIRCSAFTGQPADSRYSIQVVSPPSSGPSLTLPPPTLPTSDVLGRDGGAPVIRVLPGGIVVSTDPNGERQVLCPDGSTRIATADETLSCPIFVEVPVGGRPAPLPDEVQGWASALAAKLLAIIDTQLDNRESREWRLTEGTALQTKIDSRINFLSFIVTVLSGGG